MTDPVLIVEDMPDVRDTIAGILQDEGYKVYSASNRAKALQLVNVEFFSAAVLDVRLDESDEDNQDGLHLMREINRLSPQTAIIILTGYGTKDMVQDALRPDKDGFSPAYDFLDKTSQIFEELPSIIQKAIKHNDQIKKYQPNDKIEKVLFDSLRTRFSEISNYNILVEGLTDKQYLELAAERYKRKYDIDLLENGQVSLIASRGTKHLAPLFGTLQPLKEQGIRFVVILDGDDVGRRLAESMRQLGLQKNIHYFQLQRKGYRGKDGRSWDVEIEDLIPWHLLEAYIKKYPDAVEEQFQRGKTHKVVIRAQAKTNGGQVIDHKLQLAEFVRKNAVENDLMLFVDVLNKARKCMKLPVK